MKYTSLLIPAVTGAMILSAASSALAGNPYMQRGRTFGGGSPVYQRPNNPPQSSSRISGPNERRIENPTAGEHQIQRPSERRENEGQRGYEGRQKAEGRRENEGREENEGRQENSRNDRGEQAQVAPPVERVAQTQTRGNNYHENTGQQTPAATASAASTKTTSAAAPAPAKAQAAKSQSLLTTAENTAVTTGVSEGVKALSSDIFGSGSSSSGSSSSGSSSSGGLVNSIVDGLSDIF